MPICISKKNADGKYIVVDLLGCLTRFSSMCPFYTLRKRQKTTNKIEMENWAKIWVNMFSTFSLFLNFQTV